MPLLPAPKEMHTVPGVSPARGFTATNAGPFAEERLALRSLGALSVQADGLYYAVIAVQADATLPDLPAVLRRPAGKRAFSSRRTKVWSACCRPTPGAFSTACTPMNKPWPTMDPSAAQ